MSDEARLAVVKDVCSNCTPPDMPEDKQPKKLGLQLIVAKKSITLCLDCLKLMITKIEDIKAAERKAAESGIV